MEQVKYRHFLEEAAKNFSSYTKREPSNKTDGMIMNARYLAFKAGSEWQKDQDKTILQKIEGMNVWIQDLEMKKLFIETINKILKP